MSNVDITRYSKRLVQLFWDPEPKNDSTINSPVWCLGHKYEITDSTKAHHADTTASNASDQPSSSSVTLPAPSTAPPVRSDSRSSSFEQVERVGISDASCQGEGAAWPKQFLDDFETRIWLTYRSNFSPIAKVEDPQAVAGMSLTARIKYQMAGQGGFTSDTGWGCMIRSGQSLLANALALRRFGRG